MQIGFTTILHLAVVVANVLKFGHLTVVFLFRHLLDLFFRYNVTFSSIKKCQVHFITHFSNFKYRIFMFFLFLMYLHTILYKTNFSISRHLLPGHVNRHSKQLIYESNIVNICNDSKKFLNIFNSFFDYNFDFSHTFEFNATCNDNLVIPEFVLTLYTDLIIVLVKLKNGFFDNFYYRELWKTVALMVRFNSINFGRLISRMFVIFMFYFTWLKEFSSSIY